MSSYLLSCSLHRAVCCTSCQCLSSSVSSVKILQAHQYVEVRHGVSDQLAAQYQAKCLMSLCSAWLQTGMPLLRLMPPGAERSGARVQADELMWLTSPEDLGSGRAARAGCCHRQLGPDMSGLAVTVSPRSAHCQCTLLGR